MAHHRNSVGMVHDQAHTIRRVFAEGNLRLAAHQQILRGNQLLTVRQFAQREFVLYVADQVSRRCPHGAGRPCRNDRVIDSHAGDARLAIHVIGVRSCVIPRQSASVVKRRRLHA